jgi:hypothetical protein
MNGTAPARLRCLAGTSGSHPRQRDPVAVVTRSFVGHPSDASARDALEAEKSYRPARTSSSLKGYFLCCG